MSDAVWETFDGLFKELHRQGRRVEELERRVVELEGRLAGTTTISNAEPVIEQSPRPSGYAVMVSDAEVSFMAYSEPMTEGEMKEWYAWAAEQPELGPSVVLVWKDGK